MIARPLGLIRVPTPGTPVPVTTDTTLFASQILFRTVPGATKPTYVGVAGMNKSAAGMVGVIAALAEPTAGGAQDGQAIPSSPYQWGNSLRLADYYVDADQANEGVLVTYIEA